MSDDKPEYDSIDDIPEAEPLAIAVGGKVLVQPDKPDPAAEYPGLCELVLCKHELFYQTADGETIKSTYPSSVGEAELQANRLGVPWSEQ